VTATRVEATGTDPTPSRPRSELRSSRVLGWVLVAGIAVLAPAGYLQVRSDPLIRVTHSDVFGYTWQIRLIGAGPLSEVGPRPGVAAVGGVLQAYHVLPTEVGPVVLGIAAAAALGLACGAAVRMAFRLPTWTVGVVAGFVMFWAGTARMGIGYLANLLSLTAFVAAAWAVSARSRKGFPLVATACLIAAGLAGPGFLPVYAGIAVAWLVVSGWGILRERREGRSVFGAEPLELLAAVAGGSVLTALVMLGLMRLHLVDVVRFQTDEFAGRLSIVAGRIFIPVSIVLALVGIAAAWRWRRRGDRAGRVLCRLGIAWSLVSLGGAGLTFVKHSFPGQRALLMLLPMPIVVGLGVVWGIELVSLLRTSSVLRWAALLGAAGIAVVLFAAASSPAVRLYRIAAETPTDRQPYEVVSYAAAVKPSVPLVVVMDPPTIRGVRIWKWRLNEIRAFAPRDAIVRIIPYMGTPEMALAGSPPSTAGPATPYGEIFRTVAEQLWRQFGAQVSDHSSIVVVPKEYVDQDTWTAAAGDPTSLVSADLSVARGPRTGPVQFQGQPRLSARRTWIATVGCLFVLFVAGIGTAAAAVRPRGGSWIDVAALSPAIGVVVVTFVGLGVALVGSDPSGPAGLVSAAVLAAATLVWVATHSPPAGGEPPREEPLRPRETPATG
jgi:hypothetical protein